MQVFNSFRIGVNQNVSAPFYSAQVILQLIIDLDSAY